MNRGDVSASLTPGDRRFVNFFERHQPEEFEVGIVDQGDQFWVYWSTERASIQVGRTFTSEAEALTEFCELLDLERMRREVFGGR